MFDSYHLLFQLFLMICQPSTSQALNNPLNGQHLRILPFEFSTAIILKRNATNHVIGVDGVMVHHIEALAKLLNFSYSILPEWTIRIDDTPSARGATSYIRNGEADYILGAIVPTVARFKVLDFPASWYEGTYHCIIPYPKKELNTAASVKPFSLNVWILTVVAALITILSLSLLVNKHFSFWPATQSSTTDTTNINLGGINNFVWGNLLSQGQRFDSSRLVLRFVVGAWCLVCFFLVQSYCSTLTSHLMSPYQKPIVNSIQQLASFPDVRITINNDLGLKYIIMTAEAGNFKLLGDKLRKNSNLLCNSTTDCLTTVKQDRNTAFCSTTLVLNSIMANDFKDNGKCQYLLINDILSSTSVYTLLPKNSPYTEIVSQGILRFKEAGLYTKWFSLYTTSAWQCKLNVKSGQDNHLQKLSSMHLISAFLILFGGIVIASISFVLEKLIWSLRKHRISSPHDHQ